MRVQGEALGEEAAGVGSSWVFAESYCGFKSRSKYFLRWVAML